MPSNDAISAALIAVVRGERLWQSLLPLGFLIERKEDRWTFQHLVPGCVVPSVADIARGFLSEKSASQRTEWASFILAASGLVSLQAIEVNEHGDFLLDALWNMSFGRELPEEAWQKLQRLE